MSVSLDMSRGWRPGKTPTFRVAVDLWVTIKGVDRVIDMLYDCGQPELAGQLWDRLIELEEQACQKGTPLRGEDDE